MFNPDEKKLTYRKDLEFDYGSRGISDDEKRFEEAFGEDDMVAPGELSWSGAWVGLSNAKRTVIVIALIIFLASILIDALLVLRVIDDDCDDEGNSTRAMITIMDAIS